MSRFSSEIDALVLLIVKKNIPCDKDNIDIAELISKYVWNLTPKEAYNRVITEIPIDYYDSYQIGKVCGNCEYFGYPCVNCACYVYNNYIGRGYGTRFVTDLDSLLKDSFNIWERMTRFKPTFRFKY